MRAISKRARLLGLSAALAAGFAMQPVLAQNVSNEGRGTAVFVPYYTVNDGWRTLVNITNTTENSVPIKVRLHEARNSRDVLDFIVLLSPFDVWTAFVEQGSGGEPRLVTSDRSCTVPLAVRDSGASASTLAYSGPFRDHDATNGVIGRMSEGYVEILVMGETSGQGRAPGQPGTGPGASLGSNFGGDTAWFAKHVNGEPRDCQIIQNDFVRRVANWGDTADSPIPGDEGSGSPLARLGSLGIPGPTVATPRAGSTVDNLSVVGYDAIATANTIKVNTSLVNQNTGRAAGIDGLHIEAFGQGQNLVGAQQFPWFLEPSLASSEGLWTTTGLFDTNAGVASTQVMNEWASNPGTGARTDWVVTFPTKRFQADEDADNVQAACNVWRNATSGGGATAGSAAVGANWPGFAAPSSSAPNQLVGVACPDLDFPNVFQEGNDGIANLLVNYDIFDREEGSATFEVDGPVISPAPPEEALLSSLPYEVNVLRINNDGGASILNSPTGNTDALLVDTSVLTSGDNNGWLRMTFLDSSLSLEEPTSYATTGFVYKQRDFGNPGLNFGQANEHGYTRVQPVVETEEEL